MIVAAGGAGFGGELLESVGDLTPGAIVTAGATRRGRRGSAAPRMALASGALLSTVDRPDPGLDAVIRRHGPRWASSRVPIIVSVRADSVEDIGWLARRLDMLPDVAGVELDLCGPDRGRGGLPIGLDVEASELATVAARSSDRPAPHREAHPCGARHPGDRPGRRRRRCRRHQRHRPVARAGTRRRTGTRPAGRDVRRAVRPGHQAHRAARRLRDRPGRAHPHRRHRRREQPRRRPRPARGGRHGGRPRHGRPGRPRAAREAGARACRLVRTAAGG